MSSANYSRVKTSTFILMGFPGLEDYHILFAAPLCIIYITTLLGNSTLLLAIKTVLSLHKPMYLIISQLAFTDLALSSCIIPKMLAVFLSNNGEISFIGCLIQIFCVGSFTLLKSSTLTAMAFDRYIAVCQPLRYSAIVTHSLIAKISAASLVRASLMAVPLPFLIMGLPFCGHHVANSYCDNMPVAVLSCVDITVNNLYALVGTILTMIIDNLCIVFSYIRILMVVLQLPRRKGYRWKAFNTCSSQVCGMCVSYGLGFITLALRRFPNGIPHYFQVIVANIYLLFPPLINPIIYGGTRKEVRQGVLQQIQKLKIKLTFRYN